MPVEGKSWIAKKDVKRLVQFTRQIVFQLGIAAAWPDSVTSGWLCPIAFTGEMDHCVAPRDLRTQHIADTSVVGREIRLLDRNTSQREQPLLHQLSTGAEVGTGGTDKDFGSAMTHGVS